MKEMDWILSRPLLPLAISHHIDITTDLIANIPN